MVSEKYKKIVNALEEARDNYKYFARIGKTDILEIAFALVKKLEAKKKEMEAEGEIEYLP